MMPVSWSLMSSSWIIVVRVIIVTPGGWRRGFLKRKMENCGVTDGVAFPHFGVGHENLLALADIARYRNQDIKNPSRSSAYIHHVKIHLDGYYNVGRCTKILVCAIQGYNRALGLGSYFQRSEHVLSAEQAGHQGQQCDEQGFAFHGFLLGECLFLQINTATHEKPSNKKIPSFWRDASKRGLKRFKGFL